MTSIGFDPVAFVLMERLRTQAERERIDRRARHLRRVCQVDAREVVTALVEAAVHDPTAIPPAGLATRSRVVLS